jgi:adhesin transport system outer membrane protein
LKKEVWLDKNTAVILAYKGTLTLLFFVSFIFPLDVRAQTLDQLITEAIKTHPIVQSRVAQTAAASVALKGAQWQYFPTPSVSFESVYSSNTDVSFKGDDHVTRFRLEQPLWTGGRLKAGMNKARAGVSSSSALLEEGQREIALRVIQSYGEWYSAWLKRNAWGKSLATHDRLKNQVGHRVEKGVSAESDLLLARGRYESTAADLSAVSAEEEVAISTLSQLVGRNLTQMTLAAISLPELAQVSLADLLIQAESISPGIKRAQSEMAGTEALISQYKSDLWPDVYLRLEHQAGNLTYENADDESRIYVGFQSRFGAGLSTLSNVSEARFRHQAARSEVEVQRRAVREQVQSDYSLAKSFEQRIRALKLSIDTAESVYGSYGRQFLAGRKTWLDVMNAARDLVSTEVQLADAEASQLTVLWRLSVVVKGLSETLSGSNSL